jgi:hypothetical protein
MLHTEAVRHYWRRTIAFLPAGAVTVPITASFRMLHEPESTLKFTLKPTKSL